MNLIKIPKVIAISLISAIVPFSLCSTAAFAFDGLQNNVHSVSDLHDSTIQALAEKNLIMRDEAKLTLEKIKADNLISLESNFKEFPEDLTINLVLRDIDVASILRILAKEGGKNIVIDESVRGYISAELNDISLNEAMQIILTSEELETRVTNDTIFVASRPAMSKKGLSRRVIKTFKLNNANPVYVAQMLEASVFNKGYNVDEAASGGIFQAVASEEAEVEEGSSTGQSVLSSGKTINGKVEALVPGSAFGNAGKLASTIEIQHYRASTQAITVSNNDGGAIVIPDTRTNSVLVAGLQSDILIAEQTINYLDQPLKQVAIEVSLIELKKDDTSDLGFYTASQSGKFSGGFNAVTGEFSGYDFSSVANQAGITLNTVSSISDEIALKLKALVVNQKAKLIANPKILALNGSESIIKITDQVVSSIETTVTQTAVTYNAELSDVGIVLNILPKISDNDFVTMRIRPSITTPLPQIVIGEFQNGGAAIQVTPISTREVIIQDVRVKSGETLAIAGLTKEKDVEKISKIPVLGDIPVIGKLFRSTEYQREKNELIILITPIILNDIAYQQ